MGLKGAIKYKDAIQKITLKNIEGVSVVVDTVRVLYVEVCVLFKN